jgi:hypothetical protein
MELNVVLQRDDEEEEHNRRMLNEEELHSKASQSEMNFERYQDLSFTDHDDLRMKLAMHTSREKV